MTDEKSTPLSRKLELGANIGIIVVAIAACAILARNYLFPNSRGEGPQIKAGERLALKNVEWKANNRNIVLALSTSCHFCTESAGFYRQLSDACRKQGVHLIAVFPEPVSSGASYLQGEGVAVDEIRQAVFRDIEIRGTPTLLFVDSQGVVKQVWVGKLPSDVETQVLGKLTS